MSDYSHVNLTEVEDQAPNLGLDPEQFNLRFGRVALNCEHCGVSYLRFAPGAKAHGHRHKQQEEIYVLVTGSAEMKVGDDVLELQPFDAVRVPPHVMRGIKGGPQGAQVIAVGAPNTGPGDGDAPDPNWVWKD
jgi:quercetin dioxygenase-like cupin family protein